MTAAVTFSTRHKENSVPHILGIQKSPSLHEDVYADTGIQEAES